MNLAERAAAIELLLLDVDGVLTDGRLLYSEAGIETKSFHVRDGSGIKLWQAAGKRVAILSGRTATSVTKRAAELGIDIVLQGRHPKDDAFREILLATKLQEWQVCVVGDDLMDVPMMKTSGLSAAVADAVPEAKAAATLVTKAPGGQGAVREVIEWLLQGAGLWECVTEQYRKPLL